MKKRNIKHENERVEGNFTKNPNKISKEELHEHFDLNQDGKVTIEEYAEHINYHCDNPETLSDELDYERGFKYSKGGFTTNGRMIMKRFDGAGGKTYNLIKDDRGEKPYYTLEEEEGGKIISEGESYYEVNEISNMFGGNYAKGGSINEDYPFDVFKKIEKLKGGALLKFGNEIWVKIGNRKDQWLCKKGPEKGVISDSTVVAQRVVKSNKSLKIEDEYAKGGEIEYIKYKDEKIMYEPHFKEYYVDDSMFETLPQAKEHIDKGSPIDVRNIDAYKKGLFAEGGKVEKKENNEMILGGLAGILLGVFLKK